MRYAKQRTSEWRCVPVIPLRREMDVHECDVHAVSATGRAPSAGADGDG
jgi:hypothetical protein